MTNMELFSFSDSAVSSLNMPFPMCILTPFSLKYGIVDSISSLLLVVGAIPASLNAVCMMTIPFVSKGTSFFSINLTNCGSAASLPV